VLWDAAAHRISGIIDWSEIAIDDRAVDLAAFFHWGGEPCIRAVLSSYNGPVDEGVMARARFFAVCRGVGDIAFGLEMGRPEYIAFGKRALELCLGSEIG
jgi:hypothetical protein